MELVTGPPQLHATDVVAILHSSGHASCCNFNLAVNKGNLGTVRASVDINGRATDLVMMHDEQAGRFVFPGGKLQPEPQVLLSLPLARGRNRMEFRVLDNSSGDRIGVVADLWLWDATDRIVVVDVDGTITKSDVRGLVASQLQTTTSFLSNALNASNPWTHDITKGLNTDYTHDGVAEALTCIAESNYQILYLTARPITLADQTREFLASVGRSNNAALPEGPLITQPHGTMKALQSKHDGFKIDVLAQIQELFGAYDDRHASPSKSMPVAFVAGFGNAQTDVIAYTTAGIPPSHIFVLDKASTLKVLESGAELQSYTGLVPHLPALFPRRSAQSGRSSFGSPGHSAPGYVSSEKDISGHRSSSRSHVAPPPPKSWGGVPDLAGLWQGQQDAGGGGENPALRRMSHGEQPDKWSAREFMSNIIPGVRDLSCSHVQSNAAGAAHFSSTLQHPASTAPSKSSQSGIHIGPLDSTQPNPHQYQHAHTHPPQRAAHQAQQQEYGAPHLHTQYGVPTQHHHTHDHTREAPPYPPRHDARHPYAETQSGEPVRPLYSEHSRGRGPTQGTDVSV
jgi:hypothetical protein